MKIFNEDSFPRVLKLTTLCILVLITIAQWINHQNKTEFQIQHIKERLDQATLSLESMVQARIHNIRTLSTLAAHQIERLGILNDLSNMHVEYSQDLKQLQSVIQAQVVKIVDPSGTILYRDDRIGGYETLMINQEFFQEALVHGYGDDLLVNFAKREVRFFSAVYLSGKGSGDKIIVLEFKPASYSFWISKNDLRILAIDTNNIGVELGTLDIGTHYVKEPDSLRPVEVPLDFPSESYTVEDSYLNWLIPNELTFVRMGSVPEQLYIKTKLDFDILKNWHFNFYVDANPFIQGGKDTIRNWIILVLLTLLGYLAINRFAKHHYFIKGLTNVDPMTQLFNRKHLEENSPSLLELHDRGKIQHLGVIMLDIDKFKSVNDTYGHDAGDKVIRSLARIIQQESRSSDLAYRIGGEEFMIICLGEEAKGLAILAERLRQTVESTNAKDAGLACQFTISLGIAERTNETWQELAIKADKQLYKAKSKGRNRVEV